MPPLQSNGAGAVLITGGLGALGAFQGGDVEDTVEWHVSEAAAQSVLIDCGALVARASPGNHFGSDTFFEGGTAEMISGPVTFGRAPVLPPIAGTDSPEVVATYRMGAFTYRVPVSAGRHRVVLTFVEPTAKPGERIFDVFANGQKVVTNLDVAAMAVMC